MKKTALIIFISLMCSGCMGLLYTNVTQPRSYKSATALDAQGREVVSREAEGIACSFAVLMLVAIGDSGYDAAVKDALRKSNGGTMLFDVKSDVQYTAYLGPVFMQMCTKVTGNAVK